MPDDKRKFTGKRRPKKTRFWVKFSDRAAAAMITIGGIGTIVAVSLVAVVLVWVVWPMFQSADAEQNHISKTPSSQSSEAATAAEPEQVADASPWKEELPLHVAIDEYRLMGWAIYPSGELRVFRVNDGTQLDKIQLVEPGELTALSSPEGSNAVALGLKDGSVRIGEIEFESSFRERADVSPELQRLEIGESASMGRGMVQVTPKEQFRKTEVAAEFAEPIPLGESPIVRINLAELARSKALAVAFQDGSGTFAKLKEKKSLLGGEVSVTVKKQELPKLRHAGRLPDYLLAPGLGDNVYAIWKEGHLIRYDVSESETVVAETVHLFPDSAPPELEITALKLLLGRESLLVGDSGGNLRVWFRARNPDAQTSDGAWLLPVHELPPADSAITALGISQRSRMFVAGCESGHFRLYHATTEKLMLDGILENPQGEPLGEAVQFAKMTPKEDGLVFATKDYLVDYKFEPAYPEATVNSLFGEVWYEGYERPEAVWQSSFAGVASEMKLGLWPLLFGTFKATFYAMLFGAPIAVMAAIYTSEFLSPKVRGRVKPAVEMMASLPSVVLGFLAALVIAPILEDVVPGTLACFVCVPLALLLGSFLWQLIPHDRRMYMERYRLGFVFTMLALGFLSAFGLQMIEAPLGYLLSLVGVSGAHGPFAWLYSGLPVARQGTGGLVEQWLFAGNIKQWLDGQIGGGTGGWMMLMLPLSAVVVGLSMVWGANTKLRGISHQWSRQRFAFVNLLKFVFGLLLTVGLAWIVSSLLNLAGFDPRGSFVDTYEQRNSLIVGVVMGFAIIPIIYTIADDALSTVPAHLRFASLGAGATPWQTAVRVVIPTAMSGLFSALMIGLGRAVGETMIVLMAAGNTPITDFNIFNGFRTLSANIATEMPEAAHNSTHYRTLFFTALVLFFLTFLVNTAAEMVRIRFRKRAIQL